ncbi:hypothetical protein KKH46_02380 [Patescibacteria group bacterium]|nr:hypothetical protein [Patescibacteria group bacterium]
MKDNLEKTYVAFWKDQKKEIQKIADKRRVSFSLVVRELLQIALKVELHKLK